MLWTDKLDIDTDVIWLLNNKKYNNFEKCCFRIRFSKILKYSQIVVNGHFVLVIPIPRGGEWLGVIVWCWLTHEPVDPHLLSRGLNHGLLYEQNMLAPHVYVIIIILSVEMTKLAHFEFQAIFKYSKDESIRVPKPSGHAYWRRV